MSAITPPPDRADPDAAVGPPDADAAAGSGPGSARSRVPGFILAIAGLALTSGTIHIVAAAEHLGDDWLLGVFFVLVGAGQLFAAWWIFRRPHDERMLKIVAAGSVVVSLLWVFSRTTGIPFGPEPGRASVGVADTITTLQQLMLAAIVVALLRRPEAGDRRLAWMSGPMASRLTPAFLTMTLFMAALGGHEH